MSVNKALILGRLGGDPEVKALPSGGSVCNFSVATTDRWSDKSTGHAQERTEWHRIVVYGKLADLCAQYLRKGSEAFIEGSIHTREWQDKDGVRRTSTEIKASEVQFVGGRQDTRQDAPPSKPWQPTGSVPGGAQRGALGPGRGNPVNDLDLDSVPF